MWPCLQPLKQKCNKRDVGMSQLVSWSGPGTALCPGRCIMLRYHVQIWASWQHYSARSHPSPVGLFGALTTLHLFVVDRKPFAVWHPGRSKTWTHSNPVPRLVCKPEVELRWIGPEIFVTFRIYCRLLILMLLRFLNIATVKGNVCHTCRHIRFARLSGRKAS